MENTVYWIWFQQLFGFGTRRAQLFMDYFAHPRDIFESLKAKGQAAGMLTRDEDTGWESAMGEAEKSFQRAKDKGCDLVTPDHPQYPEKLQNIYSKPAVLYVRGDLSCLSRSLAIAMVGTRECSEYGKKAAGFLAGGLARQGVVVVSGMARGIDTVCHEAALDAGGKSIGVLGCGLDVDYPKGSFPLKGRLRQGGAVITEYPLGTLPMPAHFPLRNRILSGIASGVVVVEADTRSGSMVTASHALEQGREVFAVPGSIFSGRHGGAHCLIKDGAKLVGCVGDILEEYGVEADEKSCAETYNSGTNATTMKEEAPGGQDAQAPSPKLLPEHLSGEGKQVLALLGSEPVGVDNLAQESGFAIPALQSALTELEIYGLIKACPGRTFLLR